MSETSTVASAYNAIQMSSADGRLLDALVLTKAAAKLQQAYNEWDRLAATGDLSCLAEALRYNQRLWTIFQVDVASENTSLPAELRRNVFALSRYVDRCTMQLLASPDRSRILTLIRINENLAAGLSSRAQSPESAPAETVQPAAAEVREVFDLSL